MNDPDEKVGFNIEDLYPLSVTAHFVNHCYDTADKENNYKKDVYIWEPKNRQYSETLLTNLMREKLECSLYASNTIALMPNKEKNRYEIHSTTSGYKNIIEIVPHLYTRAITRYCLSNTSLPHTHNHS